MTAANGTENPTGDDATGTAIVGPEQPGLSGSSFVAVQRWRHDFARFETMPAAEQDLAIGRRRVDNEEIDDALFKFTRPQSGAYFWCPAMAKGRLDLAPVAI